VEQSTKRIGLVATACVLLLLTGCGGPKSSALPDPYHAAEYRGSLSFTMETANQPAGTFKATSSLTGLRLAHVGADYSSGVDVYKGTVPAQVAISYSFPNAVCDASSAQVSLDLKLTTNDEFRAYGISGTAPLALHTRCCAGADCWHVDADTVLGFTTGCDNLPDVSDTRPKPLVGAKRRTECGDPASGTVISTLSWTFVAQ
jgi:hypothetical protein